MTPLLVKLYAVLLILGAFVRSSEVTVENGGYNLLVSFSQNIPFEDGEKLLRDLEDTLKNTSNVLHKAIGLQFLKVKLKIPQSWDVSGWNIPVEDVSAHSEAEKADIFVDNTNDVVFGKFPYANQYGSCKTPGRQIVIPSAFFNVVNEFPKEISLAREWLKYRYGVFDENGFFGDPLYPSFYNVPGSDPNDVKITGCTNEEVTYNFIDKNNENCSTADRTLIERLKLDECAVQADEEGLENIRSSLMYFQEKIHNMQYVCGKDSHQHNSHAPNKQNSLCYGKSIWDIVSSSNDIKNTNMNKELVDIEFSYVKETKPKVVVAWDETAQLKSKEAIILNAIYKFIIDLPLGSQLSTISFTNTLNNEDVKVHELNEINEKKNLISELTADFVSETNADMNLALRKAIEILSSADDPTPEGIIIIITKTTGSLDSTLRKLLSKYQQTLYLRILFFSDENGKSEEIKESVSGLPNVNVEEVSMASENQTAFAKLVEMMRDTLPSVVDNKETITEKIQYLSKDSPFTFTINDLAETITFWVYSKKKSDNFVLKINQKKKEKNEITSEVFGGAILKMSCSSLDQVGNIEFTYPSSEPMLVQAEITSKAGKYFSGEVFVHDTSEEESTDQMPVIIYARIRFGTAYPMQNMKVTATIQRPNEKSVDLEMYDDGKGDPDITKNDGIYSRYFTAFSGEGTYIVKVKVENNGDSTYGAYENAGYQTCCGSFVREGSLKLGTFLKEFRTTFLAKNGRPDDGYKPSRITDLQIDQVTEENIILKWSAPGGEADSGKASKYEIKLFCEEEMVTENYVNKMVRILKKPPPMNYGTEQQVTIQILNKTQVLNVGLVAHNDKNKTSDLSNIIEIFRPSENPEFLTTLPTVTEPEKTTKVGALAGPIIGSILILVCIILAIIYYFKRKLQREKATASNIAENISKDNRDIKPTFKAADLRIKTEPVKRIESFPVLLYTHDQIKDHKETGKEPSLYKADVPVKQWKSLDVISNLRLEIENETKSLGSLSTVHPTDSSDTNGTA